VDTSHKLRDIMSETLPFLEINTIIIY